MKAVRTFMILLGVALLIAITIGITGCGGDEDTQGEEGEVLVMKPELSEPPTQTPALQDSNPTLPAEEAEVKSEVSDPEPDPEEQEPMLMDPDPEPDPEEPKPEPDPKLPAEEDIFLDQARQAYTNALKKRNKLLEENPQLDHWEAVNEVFEEAFGFNFGFVELTLLEIYLEEKPNEGGKMSMVPLILEYLRLSFKFPDKNREDILQLFRESVQEGNVSIDANNPKPVWKPKENEEEKND